MTASPTDTYLSLLRKGRKFSILRVTGERLDIGIKLKGAPADVRFKPAGAWNSMVTHRVRLDDPKQIDAQRSFRGCIRPARRPDRRGSHS